MRVCLRTGGVDRVCGSIVFRALALLPLALFGCGGDGVTSATSSTPAPDVATQVATTMKITLTLPNWTLTGTIDDTPAGRDFASLLPLTLALEDYAGTEKIGYPPRKPMTTGAPAGAKGTTGAIAYDAPWGNLALFYRDSEYADGLIVLGRLDAGVEALDGGGRAPVVISRAAPR
ncbi:MAG TPA: cyclophilin-like fold protein [Planctomycetota bacterium]|nr:cyclophilin-like fold protein [Planctomycetota bacterium]